MGKPPSSIQNGADKQRSVSEVKPKDTKSLTDEMALAAALEKALIKSLKNNEYFARLLAKAVVKNDKVIEELVAQIELDVLAEKIAEQLLNKFSSGYPPSLDLFAYLRREISVKLSKEIANKMRESVLQA